MGENKTPWSFLRFRWCSAPPTAVHGPPCLMPVQTGWMPRQWGWAFGHRHALQVLRARRSSLARRSIDRWFLAGVTTTPWICLSSWLDCAVGGLAFALLAVTTRPVLLGSISPLSRATAVGLGPLIAGGLCVVVLTAATSTAVGKNYRRRSAMEREKEIGGRREEENWQPLDWKLTVRMGYGKDVPWTVDRGMDVSD